MTTGALRRWLFGPVPASHVVVCRIGLGAVLFLAYLSRWPLVDVLYGPEGYGGYAFFQRFPESEPLAWPLVDAFSLLQHVSSGALISSLYLVLLASSLCFALGVWPIATGTLALVLHALFHGRNPGAYWGWATMIKPFLLYTILGCAVRRGRTCSAWPLRLLQVHVACAFLVLWARLGDPTWTSGKMLYLALSSRDLARLDVDWHPFARYLTIAGRAAFILELGAPVALWLRPAGKYWALALMGMFLVLTLTTSVGWWDVMMIVVLTAFLPARWLERALPGSAAGVSEAKPGRSPRHHPGRAA